MSVSLLVTILLSLAIYGVAGLQWSLQTAVGSILGSLLLVAVLVVGGLSPKVPYYGYLFLLAVAAIHIFIWGDASRVALVFGLPIVIVLGVQWSYRALRAAAHLPLFLPVAFIIVLVPLLTEDPWKFATEARVHLLWLALFAISPLAILLVLKFLRSSIAVEIRKAVERIAARDNPAVEASSVISRMTVQGGGRAECAELGKDDLAEFLMPAYTRAFMNAHIEEIIQLVVPRFKVRTMSRLVTLLIGVGTATYILIYTLAWAAMPIALAAQWSGRSVPVVHAEFLRLSIDLPLGPYISVAALFAIFATAGFLAFSSTEDRYEEAILRSVVARPAEQLILLALPLFYVVSLSDERIR